MNLPPIVPKEEITGFKKDFLKALSYAHSNYGDLVRVPLGTNLFFLASSPSLARAILIEKKDVFGKLGSDGKRSSLQPILGQGLLTNTDYSSWFMQRKFLQPLFERKAVVEMAEEIVQAGQRLLQKWQNQGGQVINLYEDMLAVTLDVIYSIVFSKSVPNEPLCVPLSLATAKSSKLPILKHLDETVYSYIQQRRDSGEYYGDLLDSLLLAKDCTGSSMSDKQLRDEILTIFSAGHETTAAALTWTWYCLLKNPVKLLLLKKELTQVLQGKFPCASSVNNLPYTSAIIKESLRLYPAIPSCPRIALVNTQLAGYDIPKGAKIFVSIYNIHHHRKFWSEPNEFYPERFLGQKNFPKKAYIPFGLGQRHCLGRHLAMLETQLLLALIAQNVEFELIEKAPVTKKVAISLFPAKGLKVLLTAIDS